MGSTAGAPQTVLNSVRNAASDIHSFRHSTILYTDSTVCIHLNDVKRPFSRIVKFPSDVCTGHKYFITNLVVIVYPETIFPDIVGINDFLFPKPDGFPVGYEFYI